MNKKANRPPTTKLKKLLPQWKDEKPELKSVHSQVLQEVVKRVDLAYQAFFRRVKDSKDPGYPRFKGKDRYDRFTCTQSGFSLKPGNLWLSKLSPWWLRNSLGSVHTWRTPEA